MARDLHNFVLHELTSCVLWLPLRLGHARNLAQEVNGVGSAARGTITNGRWTRGRKGHAYQPWGGTSGRIVVADQGAADPTRLTAAGTVLAFGDQFYPPGGLGPATQRRLLSKRDDGGTCFDTYVDRATQTYGFYDGASIALYAYSVRVRMVAITWVSGVAPKLYCDALFINNFNAAITTTANDSDLYIGDYADPAADQQLETALYDALLFNAALTAEQIGIIYDLWMTEASPDVTRGRKRLWQVQKEIKNASNLVLHMGRKEKLIVPDLSGNGNQGVVTPPVMAAHGVHGNALSFAGEAAGGGRVTIAADATINDLANASVVAKIRVAGAGGDGYGRLFLKGAPTWDCYYTVAGSVITLTIRVTYAGGTSVWFTTALTVGLETHVAIVHNKGSVAADPIVYVDGVAVAVSVSARATGAMSTDAANALVLASSSGTQTWNGTIEDFRVYDKLLTAEEVRDLYLEGARKPLLYTPREEFPESVAAVAAGGECGPWEVLSGTHKWVDDGTDRGAEQATSGLLAMRQPHAYGSWYFKFEADLTGGGAPIVEFISNDTSAIGSATKNAYLIQPYSGALYLQRRINGAAVNLASMTLAAGTYVCFVSRRTSGVFHVWIKGGAYSDWTLVCNATDTTHSASSFAVIEHASNPSRVSDFRVYQAAMTPHEMERLGHDWLVSTGTWSGAMSGSIGGVSEPMYVNSVAGILYQPSDQAYGTWPFRLKKADISTTTLMPIATKPGAYATSGQNGYLLYVSNTEIVYLFRITNGGVAATLITTGAGYIAAATEYLFRLTRTSAGLFTLYIKGGAYASWTVVGSATDNTHTTSQYMVADLYAADQIGRVATTDEVQAAA